MRKAAHGSAASVAILCLCLVLIAGAASASDWPSWRGRSQNGVSEETGLVSSWSTDGENLIWFQEYVARSTPAVFDGPGLCERAHRRRRRQEGDRHLLERGRRHQALGAQLQRRQHHGAVQPRRLGQRDRRPGHRLPLCVEHRRPPPLLRPRRRRRVEAGGSPRISGVRRGMAGAPRRPSSTKTVSSSASSVPCGAISAARRVIGMWRSTSRAAECSGFRRRVAAPRT